MARPKTDSKKVAVTLPRGALRALDQLVSRKLYGESRSEVACYLIVTAIDALIEKRRLKDPSKGN
jgi:hypothetical protein